MAYQHLGLKYIALNGDRDQEKLFDLDD